ncbi:MAG: alpha-mannosidase [Spirochaetales bacterium]|nr:alpha-mannosidase [Spirochaetales bacterium]
MLVPKIEYRIEQYLRYLKKNRYRTIRALDLKVFETLDHDRRTPPSEGEGWKEAVLPYPYGKEWTSFWFRSEMILPEEVEGQEVFLRVQPQADSLAYINGEPFGAFNPFHDEIRLSDKAAAGTSVTLDLEVYSGHKFPGEHPFQDNHVILTLDRKIPDYPNVFLFADLAVKNGPFYDLFYDATVLFELAHTLSENSLRRAEVLKGLYDALTAIRYTGSEEEQLEQAEEARKVLKPMLSAVNSETAPEILLIGHAHIDHAWLWPLWETERKVARTFSNMCRYAEEFPEFIFIQSQPVQLEEMERDYPAVFKSVKDAYHRGQWEPNGGMWVEADCNVTGGESLIRQFLVGKRTTKRILGYESDTLWLPDVFGYAAALPQILRGCGIDYFVTSKINWNDTTRFPYDSFVWKGIDGTGVNTHYITSRENGYNGAVRPSHFNDTWNNVQHKEVQNRVVKSIGEGDGGGGTLRKDLEYARRMENLEGIPKSRWATVSSAMKEVFSRQDELPRWQGELYLELHRGTYTSQARTKRFNRKLEGSLRSAEMIHALVNGISGRGVYPEEILDRNWKKLLTRQFHDIIPGSSIRQVYEEAEATYAEMTEEMDGLIRRGMGEIADEAQEGFTVFNSLNWRTEELPLALPASFADASAVQDGEGRSYPIQLIKDTEGREQPLALVSLNPLSAGGFTRGETSEGKSPFSWDGEMLETPFYRVRFDKAMGMVSFVDRESGREFADTAEGALPLNAFQTAEDYPILWDAWDIDADWIRHAMREDRLEECALISEGPLLIQFRLKYRVGRCSTLSQDLFFYAGNRRVDFKTSVEWHEDHQLLKVAFPLSLVSDSVRCEVQYGHVNRPTTSNTPREAAQFEVCAHKWVSLEEGDFGAALMNDCKYGHDIKGSLVRLTLLKSAKAPDPEADMGHHEFVYSFLPYRGAFEVQKVVRPAYELNQDFPLVPGLPSLGEAMKPFAEVADRNIILETVKAADDGSGDLIMRLYEASGSRSSCSLKTGFSWKEAKETNMLEREGVPADSGKEALELSFRPFEIKTLRFVL